MFGKFVQSCPGHPYFFYFYSFKKFEIILRVH